MVNRSAEQAALKKMLITTLNRELLEYSMLNDGYLIDWDDTKQRKYAIVYKTSEDIFYAEPNADHVIGTVYFISKSVATQAVSDVVMPFIKEHPEFTW